MSAGNEEVRSLTGERKQLKTPDPTKPTQLNNSAEGKPAANDDIWKSKVEP